LQWPVAVLAVPAVGRYIVYAHVQRMTAYVPIPLESMCVTHHVCTCPADGRHIVYAHVQRMTAYVPIPLGKIVYAHVQRMTAYVLAVTTKTKHYGMCVTLDAIKYP
jgi:hypothetical protein